MAIMDQLAEFVYETDFHDIPEETIAFTKFLCSKIVAAMLLGARTRAGRRTVEYVAEHRGIDEVGIIGAGIRCQLEDAVFANGMTCHAAELEDDMFPSATSDITIFPVIFPLAEKLGLSGKTLITASALGIEIMNRIGRFPLSGKGFTDLPFYGVIGAAITAGKAMNLNPDQLKCAVGIAIGRAGGFIVNFGTDAHYIESAGACKDGITAALLAEKGLTGNPDVERWLKDLLAGQEFDLREVTDNLGTPPWRVHEIWIKKYPCCFLTHRHIDMLSDILTETGISHTEIEKIKIHVGPVDNICNRPEPTDTEDARFSFHHILSALSLDGELDSHHFTDEKLTDPRYREAWKKVQVINHPEWPAEFMSGVAKIKVTLKNGEQLVKKRLQAKGGPEAPLSEEEFKKLYFKYTRTVLNPEDQTYTWHTLFHLEEMDDLMPLTDKIVFPDRSA